jgi:virginiamycin B lyase
MVSSRLRRHRPGVERLGDRRLLSAITVFPLPTKYSSPEPYAGLTAGPDGNLWFIESSSSGGSAIGRITPAGALTDFPLLPGTGNPGSLTVGPDGNL